MSSIYKICFELTAVFVVCLRVVCAVASDRMLGERKNLQLDLLAQRQVVNAQTVHVRGDDRAVELAVLHHLIALRGEQDGGSRECSITELVSI